MPVSRPAFISRHKKPPQDATHQQVYSADFSTIFEVPLHHVHHIPSRATRLVLCDAYDAKNPVSCATGSRCKGVHCDLTDARRCSIHVNYAYRSAQAVKFERFPAGETLYIAAPNDTETMDVIASDLVLRTRALESSRRPLSHCAHYYFNRTCNLGSDCQFIHAVYIDPNAREGQRAPLPSQMGRSYRPEDRRKCRGVNSSDAHASSAHHALCESSVNSDPATEGVDLSSASSETGADILPVKQSPSRPAQVYRFNPYSHHSAYLVLDV